MAAPYLCETRRGQDGRIVEKTETVRGRRSVWTYAYDEAERLSEAKLDGRLIFHGWYDREGRRMRDYLPATAGANYRDYQYTPDNRLLRAGSAQFSHDERGFRSIRSDKGVYTLYEYAPDYRLLKAEEEGRDNTLTFVHDEDGQRIAKYRNGELVEAYQWLDFIRLAGFHDGQHGYEFAYREGERTPHAMRRDDGATATLHYDQVGSLRVVADAEGNVIQEVLYDPFGGIIEDTNPALRLPLGFAGGLHDRDLNLVRFGWRDYDVSTGRWTAPDPIGDRGGDPDWYGYCLDDPVNGIDSLGLKGRKFGGADSEAGLFFNIGRMTYDNAKEQLTVTDTDGMTRKQYDATSGVPGVTDHTIKDKGPTPPGEYRINPDEISPTNFFRKHFDIRDWGNFRTPMHPSRKTETYNRSGIMMHGGEKPGSAGCIDVGCNDENLFSLMKKQKKNIAVKVK